MLMPIARKFSVLFIFGVVTWLRTVEIYRINLRSMSTRTGEQGSESRNSSQTLAARHCASDRQPVHYGSAASPATRPAERYGELVTDKNLRSKGRRTPHSRTQKQNSISNIVAVWLPIAITR